MTPAIIRQTKTLFILFLATFFITNSFAQAYILDESYKDKDFLAFKLKLVKVLMDEDKKGLLELVDENVIVSRHADPGKKGFETYFFNEGSNESSFWKEALSVVSYGFRNKEVEDWEKKEHGAQKIFYAPSFHKDFHWMHGGEREKFNNKCLVLGDKVNVREKPTTKSKVIGRLSYEPVETNLEPGGEWNPGIWENTEKDEKYPHWYEVKLKNGKIGYIVADYISDNYSIDFRVAKTNDGWKIISFTIPSGC